LKYVKQPLQYQSSREVYTPNLIKLRAYLQFLLGPTNIKNAWEAR